MHFSNRHLIIVIIISIVIVFIYNYDVYIVNKNESLCENIFIDKKTLKEIKPAKKQQKLTSDEMSLHEEIYNHLNENGYFNESCELPKLKAVKFNLKSPFKNEVMKSVTKILSTIPTDLNDTTVIQILKYFSKIYWK